MKIKITFKDIPEDSELYKTYKSHKLSIEYNNVDIDTVALNNVVSEMCNEYGVTVRKECKLDMDFKYNRLADDKEVVR